MTPFTSPTLTWDRKVVLKEPQAYCDVVVAVKTGVKNFSTTLIARASQDPQLIRLGTMKCCQQKKQREMLHEFKIASYCPT